MIPVEKIKLKRHFIYYALYSGRGLQLKVVSSPLHGKKVHHFCGLLWRETSDHITFQHYILIQPCRYNKRLRVLKADTYWHNNSKREKLRSDGIKFNATFLSKTTVHTFCFDSD